MDTPNTHMYTICVLGVSNLESEWSCICALGVSLPSLCQARKVSGHVYVCWGSSNTHTHDQSLCWLGTGLVTIPQHTYTWPLTFLSWCRLGNDTPNTHMSCICVLGVSLPSLYQDRKVIGHVYVCWGYRYQAWTKTGKGGLVTIPPTHIYMTTHFPGLVQAW
jgi:hypothetical protein